MFFKNRVHGPRFLVKHRLDEKMKNRTERPHRGRIAPVLVGFLFAIALSMMATPAQAYPSNCSSAIVANGGEAMCGGGSGYVQVILGCQNIFGFWENPTGPWTQAGVGVSRTGCSFGYFIKWAGYLAKD